ncbi:hypothetical protein FB639_006102, partial [Coemansia asiatica]
MLTGDKVETAINIAKSCRLIDTDVVEVTKLDNNDADAGCKEKEKGAAAAAAAANGSGQVDENDGHASKDRMTLLVLQSMTDSVELERVLTQALVAARNMTASVDQRFERRSRLEKLRRGMKRFGNLFVFHRGVAAAPLREEIAEVHESLLDHDALENKNDAAVAGKSPLTVSAPETRSGSWEKATSDSAHYLESPIVDPGEKGHADKLNAHGIQQQQQQQQQRLANTEIEWADQIEASSRSQDHGGGGGGGGGIGGHDQSETKNVKESKRSRVVSTAESSSSSSSSSSSHASDTTKGVSKRGPGSNAGESSNGTSTRVSDFPSRAMSSNGIDNSKTGNGPSLAVVIDGETLSAMEEHASAGILD